MLSAIALLSLLPFQLQAQSHHELKKQLKNIILFDSELDLKDIPSLSIGIAIDSANYFFQYGFGPDSNTNFTSQSLFEIGDLTKIFTALTMNRIAEELNFSLSDSIQSHCPDIFPNEDLNNASFIDLLTHYSGLSKFPDGLGENQDDPKNPFANYSKDDLFDYLAEVKIRDQGEFHYSQTGYAMLEYCIEQLTGKYFNENIHSTCAALGLDTTNVIGSDSLILKGHSLSGNQTPMSSYSSFQSALGIVSSTEDLIKLAQKSWMSPPTWYQNCYADSRKIPQAAPMRIAQGWHIFEDKKYAPVLLHSGKTTGFRSFIALVPATKTAVVVLSNSIQSHENLGMYILKMLNYEWKHPDGVKKKRK